MAVSRRVISACAATARIVAPTVADADIKVAVATELHVPGVMVPGVRRACCPPGPARLPGSTWFD